MDSKDKCIFSFGAIADVQYADIDNRLNYSQTNTRFYRHSLVKLKEAIDYWNSNDARPSFIVQLGDLIDGFNNERGKAHSSNILEKLLVEFDTLHRPVHHTLGNHEFYNFTRAELMCNGLFSGGDYETTKRDTKCQCFPDEVIDTGVGQEMPAAYYHFSPAPGFRFVILDTYDMSVIGHIKTCPVYQESMDILRSFNHNECLDSPCGIHNPAHVRFVAYNGGVGDAQMDWLTGVLEKASNSEEKVLLFGHIPINPNLTGGTCLLWNYQDVLDRIHQSKCVVGVVSGHTHDHAQYVDESGIFYVSLPGVIEIPPGKNGFGTFDVYADKIVLRGVGDVRSCEIKFIE